MGSGGDHGADAEGSAVVEDEGHCIQRQTLNLKNLNQPKTLGPKGLGQRAHRAFPQKKNRLTYLQYGFQPKLLDLNGHILVAANIDIVPRLGPKACKEKQPGFGFRAMRSPRALRLVFRS